MSDPSQERPVAHHLPLNQFPPPTMPLPPPGVEPVPWRRLDPRMLLVHPVLELVRFLPFVVGVFVLGSNSSGVQWQLLGVAVPIALGVLRFFSTRYRITPQQIELRRGLLSRQVLTARLDRVRAVEMKSSPIHRVLGLAKVEIGTASPLKTEVAKFELDSLRIEEAREMRAALLHRSGIQPATGTSDAAVVGDPAQTSSPYAAESPDDVLMRLDPRWARFAPLTTSGNVVAAGLLGLAAQFTDRLNLGVVRASQVEDLISGASVAGLVVLVLATFLVLGAVLAVLGYLITNWGFTLSRDARGRSFQVRRGLLTTTETSLERQRVRGVEVGEPLGLRAAGAGRLSVIVTGLSRSEQSSTQLVPPAPRAVVRSVAVDLLDEAAPLELVLEQHGPAARRRRYTRAFSGAAILLVLTIVLAASTPLPMWWVLPTLLTLPAAGLLAADRYRRLGHGLTPEYLVVRSGTLRGRRDVLQRSGIIGWNLQQSWFQRRAGLVTLVATTAAGLQAYAAIDVPEAQAVALADAAVPGLLSPFLAGPVVSLVN